MKKMREVRRIDFSHTGEDWAVLCQQGNEVGVKLTMSEVILMQFTGLLDKLGREIYEGDIVKHPWLSKGKDDEYGIIEFKNDAYFHHWVIEFGCWDDKEFEIIGNIHENPDLLK